MSFFATFALVFILVIRPQEIWPALAVLRLLDVFTGLAVLGVLVDVGLRRQKPPYSSPQLPLLGAFLVSSYFSSALSAGREGIDLTTTRATIAAVFMLVVMYGAGTFKRLVAMIALLVGMAVFVSAVAIHQGHQEPVCIELPQDDPGATEEGEPDGRGCETAWGCSKDGKADVDYACERVGLFRTVSVVRRVRWRGQLNDPNELSVYLGAVMPLLFALSAQVKRRWFTAASLAMVAAWLYAVILTQSRGGQLVVGAVLGIYFVSRFGVLKGLLVGALLAFPVLLYGGRADRMAEASAEERVGLLLDGVNLFLQHPIFGVGVDQFKEHMAIVQTAHNAYLLAATELGFPGFVVWSGLLWTSLKIPLAVLRRPEAPARLKPLAMGIVVSFVGVAIGIFFLSFTYKQLLFIWLGLSGALYRVASVEDPGYSVKIGARDLLGVVATDAAILAMIFAYTRLRA